LRFNGVTNKSIELFAVNKTEDLSSISFNNSYTESTSINVSPINVSPINVSPINVSPINVSPINVSPINVAHFLHLNKFPSEKVISKKQAALKKIRKI
jgi:hypothetical protein